MSELYTRFMEWVMPFLQANWQFFFHCNRCTVPVGGQSFAGNGFAIRRAKMCWDFGPLFFATLEKRVSRYSGDQRSPHYLMWPSAVDTDVKA